MKSTDVLIIGAGATGLMAARELARAGKRITVLDARDRCGGRIHTLNHEIFLTNAELGAEFIHGDLPVTLNVLKEAGIPYHSSAAEMWHFKNGKLDREGEFAEGWDLLMKRLKALKQDISISDFLDEHFPGAKYEALKNSVVKFVSGYDTADPAKASSFALREEWKNEDNEAQHRIKGGYGVMIKYLEDEITSAGGSIYLNSSVKQIYWQQGYVKIVTEDGSAYEADRLIVALPLGVLQANKDEKGAIEFIPEIPEYRQAIQSMGFGAIIKILIEFDERFWEKTPGVSLKNMGFILSDEEIPTWWTQIPQHSPVLTGWLGGPEAAEKKDVSNEELLQQSLQSLSNIFTREYQELKDKVVAFNIVNWTADPFTRGSYAYDTVAAPVSRKILNNSISDTLFFAGEHLYEGSAMGTVEAALTSGQAVAKKMV